MKGDTGPATFYFLFGDPDRRRWEDGRRYGFVSAGGGVRWSRPLRRLNVGDQVLVHVPTKGYVGVGVVSGDCRRINKYTVEIDGTKRPLLSAPLVSPGLAAGAKDPKLAEYVVPVHWLATVSEASAYWRTGLFWSRTTVWPFDDHAMANEIRRRLGA